VLTYLFVFCILYCTALRDAFSEF